MPYRQDYSLGGSNIIGMARSNKMLDTIIIQQMKNKGLQIMWFGCIKTLTKYINLQLEKKYPNVRNQLEKQKQFKMAKQNLINGSAVETKQELQNDN